MCKGRNWKLASSRTEIKSLCSRWRSLFARKQCKLIYLKGQAGVILYFYLLSISHLKYKIFKGLKPTVRWYLPSSPSCLCYAAPSPLIPTVKSLKPVNACMLLLKMAQQSPKTAGHCNFLIKVTYTGGNSAFGTIFIGGLIHIWCSIGYLD